MSKTKGLLLAVAVAAMAFTFSCSGDEPNEGGNPSSSSGGGGSSSSGGGQGGGSSSGGGGGNTVSWQGKDYRTAVIGSQTWFAENLNYNAPGSKCYGEGGEAEIDWNGGFPITATLSPAEVQANCDIYGRLYDWATAMGLNENCNESNCANDIQAKHKGICPTGWHIPSEADWDALMTAVGGLDIAGTKLKAMSGWNYDEDDGVSGNGTDNYGFSALPGGRRYSDNNFGFGSFGQLGYWWSASEDDSLSAYGRNIHCCREYANYRPYDKSALFSVRCVKD